MRLAEARGEPGAEDLQLSPSRARPNSTRVPVDARDAGRPRPPRCGPAEPPDMLGHRREVVMGEHRDMPEHVVETVGLLEIVELLARADEIADREDPLASMAKKMSSGTSPVTATVRQPVRGSRIALSPSRSGTPGCDSRNRSMPSRNGETTRVPSSSTCRANSRSQTAWSSAVKASQHCGTT